MSWIVDCIEEHLGRGKARKAAREGRSVMIMMFVCLFVCLFACLLVCLFVCLLACLLLVVLKQIKKWNSSKDTHAQSNFQDTCRSSLGILYLNMQHLPLLLPVHKNRENNEDNHHNNDRKHDRCHCNRSVFLLRLNCRFLARNGCTKGPKHVFYVENTPKKRL